MARETRRSRLDQPLDRSRSLRPSVDPEVFGRASERVARFIGSWRFIAYMTIFVVAWVVFNTVGPESWRFDPWQFIGLTLVLSLQASYAAPLILLAQNRQSDRDRVQYQEDRASTERLLADARSQLVDARLEQGQALTALAKALGGGWDETFAKK